VISVGTLDIDVPARAVGYETGYTCPPRVTQLLGGFTILASNPHMHRRGATFRTELLPAERDPVVLTDIARWDFDDQRTYAMSPPVAWERGDALRVTCTYDNPTDTPIQFGEGTGDEMCFDFMMAYPITQWPSGLPRACVDLDRFGF
jgi:hypothetical protein